MGPEGKEGQGRGQGNRACKFLEICEIVDRASEDKDDGPDDEVDLRGKEGKWIWGGRGDEDFSWQVILRGMWVILLEVSKASGYVGVEFRSRISGGSTRM